MPARVKQVQPQLQTFRKLEQCVIISPFDLFFFDTDAAHTVWLDNLFLRLDQTDSELGATLVYWEPELASNSSLWMTSVTVECDGKDQTRAVFAKQGNTVFSRGVPPHCVVFHLCVASATSMRSTQHSPCHLCCNLVTCKTLACCIPAASCFISTI